MSEPTNPDFKYWAFISYSHRDKAWGDWLHKGLEHYRVPRPLAGKGSTRGEPVPARVFPVFRDREELPTAVDLGEIINRALERSRYLIVICSPASARSQWVNEEILQFKRLGRENRVLAIIVDGEPNAAEGKPGFAKEAECFPEALKFRLGATGELSEVRTEPIAADAREHADGKSNALLKLLAGVLGVNFDDLKRRDEEQRRRRQRVALATVSGLLVVFTALAITAWVQRQHAVAERDRADTAAKEAERRRIEAVAERERAERHLTQALAEQGGNYLNQARAAFAAHRLTAAAELAGRALGSIEVEPGQFRPLLTSGTANHQAATLLQRSTEGLLRYRRSSDPFRHFASVFDEDVGRRRFHAADNATVRSYDLDGSRLRWEIELPEGDVIGVTSEPEGRVVLALHRAGISRVDAESGKSIGFVATEEEMIGVMGAVKDKVVALGAGGDLLLVHAATGRVDARAKPAAGMRAHAIPSDGQVLLVWDGKVVSEYALAGLELKRTTPVAVEGDVGVFAADGRELISADAMGRIARIDTATGTGAVIGAQEAPVPVLAIDARGGEIHAIDRTGMLFRLNTDGTRTDCFRTPLQFVTHLRVDRARDEMLAVGLEATLRETNVYRASVSGAFRNFAPGGGFMVGGMMAASCLHPNGGLMFYETVRGLAGHNLQTNQYGVVHTKRDGEQLLDIAIAPGGFVLGWLNRDGEIATIDLRNVGEPRRAAIELGRSVIGPSNRLALSPDGAAAYVAAPPGIVKVDMTSGERETLLEMPFGALMVAPGNRENRLFVSTMGGLMVLNVTTREVEQTIKREEISSFTDVVWDAEHVYAAGYRGSQGVLLVLRGSDYTPVAEVSGHAGGIDGIMRLRDGGIVLTGADDQTLWRFEALEVRKHVPDPSDSFERSGTYRATRGGRLHLPDNRYGDSVLEIDPDTGAVVRRLGHGLQDGAGYDFTRHRYSGENARAIVLTDTDGEVHVFDRATLQRTSHFVSGGEVSAIAAAREAEELTVIDGDGGVSRFGFDGSLRWRRSPPEEHRPDRIDASFDDRWIVLNAPRHVTIVNAKDGAVVREFSECAEVQVADERAIVRPVSKGLRCVSLSTGAELWRSETASAAYAGFRALPEENLLMAWIDGGELHYLALGGGEHLLAESRWTTTGVSVGGPARDYFVEDGGWRRRFGAKAPAWMGE